MSRRTKYLVAVALALAPTIVAPEVFSSAVHNNKLPFDATAVGDDGMPPPQNSNPRHHHHNRASHLSSSASSLDSSHHEDNEQDGAKSSTSGQDEYQNAASSARYERDSHADIDGSMTASSLFRIENDHGRQLRGGKKTTTRAMQEETVEDDDEYYYDDDDAYDDDEPVPAELWYVDWFTNDCTTGYPEWGMHTFDTKQLCCSTMLSWMPIQDCMAASDGMKPMTSNYTKDGDPCPPEYVGGTHYRTKDRVSLLDPRTGEGTTYRCKEGAISLYCNHFPPVWQRTSLDGATTHEISDDLGWERVGTCNDLSSNITFTPSTVRPLTGKPSSSPTGKPSSSPTGKPSSSPGRPTLPVDTLFTSKPSSAVTPSATSPVASPIDKPSGGRLPTTPPPSTPSSPGGTPRTTPSPLGMISAPLKPVGGRPSGKSGKGNKRSKGSKRGKSANAYTSGSAADATTAINRLVQDENFLVVPEYCWRSGTKCTTDAEDFACCTKCSDGFCE